jgi:membrane-bound serine protease (ClpP class)
MGAVVIVLLALAVALLVAEAHVPSGALGVLGVGSLVAAGIVYRDEGHDLPIVAIVVGALLIGGFFLLASRKVLATYRTQPVRTGYEGLAGTIAEARTQLDPEGQVFADGSIWHARLIDGTRAAPGDRVRVESVDGLTLVVKAVPSEQGARG